MQISFHGAARCVTGSKHLVTTNSGTNILFDCGLFQGNPAEADKLNRHFSFSPAAVDFLLLSHAHIDHCGLIPRLVKEGFKGKIFCTPATFDLARILLMDSARIHEADIMYHNKKRKKRGESLLEALYTEEDVVDALQYFEIVNYGEEVRLNREATFSYTDVGHILGSAAVHLNVTEEGKETRITFSGDVGRYRDELLRAPETFRQADYIILESTYGNSLHEEASLSESKLLEIILETCVKKQGKLVIPSFSVGRTQELVYALNRLEITKHLPDVDFYVDSPLSVEATQVMIQHSRELNERFQEYCKRDKEPFGFSRLHYITDAADSKKLNELREPCVIISASGMADAGRVKHHIKHVITEHKNTILLVGYCEPNSLGGKLMRGDTEVTLFGEPFPVNAEVKTLRSMSAHGDYNDLIRFVFNQDTSVVKKMFLVHGEYDVQQDFAVKLNTLGFNQVEIPSMHQSFEL